MFSRSSVSKSVSDPHHFLPYGSSSTEEIPGDEVTKLNTTEWNKGGKSTVKSMGIGTEWESVKGVDSKLSEKNECAQIQGISSRKWNETANLNGESSKNGLWNIKGCCWGEMESVKSSGTTFSIEVKVEWSTERGNGWNSREWTLASNQNRWFIRKIQRETGRGLVGKRSY